MAQRVCVTGANGQAGRAVVRDLLDHGYEVAATDITGTRDNGVLRADLTDYGQALEVLHGADAVVHLANIPAPGRSRVLSGFGREDTADRWYESDQGPNSPVSHAAPANCVSCGFFVLLSGRLGRVFGACGNAYAPDDGRVVSADHGCGAHSEAVLTGSTAQATAPVIDEFGYDMFDLPGVSVEETVFEPLSRGAD